MSCNNNKDLTIRFDKNTMMRDRTLTQTQSPPKQLWLPAPHQKSMSNARGHFRKHGTSSRPLDDADDYEDAGDQHIQLIGRALPGADSSSSSQSAFAPRTRPDKFAELRAGVVTDARGQQRFHGAFTGGFSAGYFNSVGSIAGFAPQTFVSSRARRTGVLHWQAESTLAQSLLTLPFAVQIEPRLVPRTLWTRCATDHCFSPISAP